MGLEWARPGIGVRQRMFVPVSIFHEVGRARLVSIPRAEGPRNCGQSARAPTREMERARKTPVAKESVFTRQEIEPPTAKVANKKSEMSDEWVPAFLTQRPQRSQGKAQNSRR